MQIDTKLLKCWSSTKLGNIVMRDTPRYLLFVVCARGGWGVGGH